MKTGHKPGEPRCALSRIVPESINVEQEKRNGWQVHRILVVGESDKRLTWIERQVVAGIGKRLYERSGG